MNIFKEFMKLRFPNLTETQDVYYWKVWKDRFDNGLEYAKNYMDFESLECFKKVLLLWIKDVFK